MCLALLEAGQVAGWGYAFLGGKMNDCVVCLGGLVYYCSFKTYDFMNGFTVISLSKGFTFQHN